MFVIIFLLCRTRRGWIVVCNVASYTRKHWLAVDYVFTAIYLYQRKAAWREAILSKVCVQQLSFYWLSPLSTTLFRRGNRVADDQ